MISTEHTQSLTDFRLKAAETLQRLNQTGEAEIITVNGEARAVPLAPAVYDETAREYQLARDIGRQHPFALFGRRRRRGSRRGIRRH